MTHKYKAERKCRYVGLKALFNWKSLAANISYLLFKSKRPWTRFAGRQENRLAAHLSPVKQKQTEMEKEKCPPNISRPMQEINEVARKPSEHLYLQELMVQENEDELRTADLLTLVMRKLYSSTMEGFFDSSTDYAPNIYVFVAWKEWKRWSLLGNKAALVKGSVKITIRVRQFKPHWLKIKVNSMIK